MTTTHSASRTARQRARAELTREIKEEARRQLAASGAQGLSLRSVARELGMVSSALYRYFRSRDELLTALIIDAYEALGAAAETASSALPAADIRGRDDLLTALIIDAYDALGDSVEQSGAALPRADSRGRWRACCHAVRDWALAHPHEYALIYGSPVPGYQAPQATVASAVRVVRVMGSILADAEAGTGHAGAQHRKEPLPAELAQQVAIVAEGINAVPTQVGVNRPRWSPAMRTLSR